VCGASSQQTQIEAAQANFYNTLTSQYSTVFGQDQAILGQLTKAFEPILKAGPNQQGFSAQELQSLESQATTGVGQNYKNAQAALATQQAAQGGGNAFVPSGAQQEQRAQLAQSAAATSSGEQLGIEQANYAQGLQNFQMAANALGGVSSQLNPQGFANSATGAGSAASTTANEITQANNSWMNLVSGAIGSAAGAFGAYEGAK